MITFLILAAFVLGLLAVTRLSRVYELTAELRGKREEEISDRETKMNARLLWAFPFVYFSSFLCSPCITPRRCCPFRPVNTECGWTT